MPSADLIPSPLSEVSSFLAAPLSLVTLSPSPLVKSLFVLESFCLSDSVLSAESSFLAAPLFLVTLSPSPLVESLFVLESFCLSDSVLSAESSFLAAFSPLLAGCGFAGSIGLFNHTGIAGKTISGVGFCSIFRELRTGVSICAIC